MAMGSGAGCWAADARLGLDSQLPLGASRKLLSLSVRMGTIPYLSLRLTSYCCFSLCVCGLCVCEKQKGRVISLCCEGLNKQIVTATARGEGKSEVIF